MNAAHHAHVKTIVGQNFGKLSFANGANGGHEIHAVIVHDMFECLHAWHGAFDTDLHQVIGQYPATSAAAKSALVDGFRRHVVEVVVNLDYELVRGRQGHAALDP